MAGAKPGKSAKGITHADEPDFAPVFFWKFKVGLDGDRETGVQLRIFSARSPIHLGSER
jgi:hypothetical protein